MLENNTMTLVIIWDHLTVHELPLIIFFLFEC